MLVTWRTTSIPGENQSEVIQSSLTGSSVSQYREDNELIEILLRGTVHERTELSLLPSLAVPTDNGKSVALSQIATLEYGFEEGIIWHRNRLPTVTVRADIYGKEQPATLVQQILPTLEGVRAELPDGYLLDVGGTVEDSARGQNSVKAGVPLFIVVVLTLLMLQLREKVGMIELTAPKRRQDHDVHLGVAEEPEHMLEQHRVTATGEHRVPVVYRVGAPHVCGRHSAGGRAVLHVRHAADRSAHGCEGV